MAAAVSASSADAATNTERIRHYYLLPLLPNQGDIALDELRRADLHDVQDALLRRRLAKRTIDGAFSALSALMRDAVVGRLMRGLKGTHHIVDRARRGRWTLFPDWLARAVEPADDGYLFRWPRGKLWAVRNFYRDVWTPAQERSRVAFTLYDPRHTFASRLLSAGIPVVEVSAWMAHTIRAGGQEVVNTTTRVYAHDRRASRASAARARRARRTQRIRRRWCLSPSDPSSTLIPTLNRPGGEEALRTDWSTTWRPPGRGSARPMAHAAELRSLRTAATASISTSAPGGPTSETFWRR